MWEAFSVERVGDWMQVVNSKSEYLNPKQIRITEIQITKTLMRGCRKRAEGTKAQEHKGTEAQSTRDFA